MIELRHRKEPNRAPGFWKKFPGGGFSFVSVREREDGRVGAYAECREEEQLVLAGSILYAASCCRRGANRFSVPPWPTDRLLLAAKVHATPVRSFYGKAKAGWG
jgi:hypothetical protein